MSVLSHTLIRNTLVASDLGMLYESFDMQNWNYAKDFLSSNPLPHSEDLIDAFENFLFRIDDINSNDLFEETANQIIQLFLRSAYLYHQITPSLPCGRHVQDSTLIHNLCMENKHKALAMLLRNIDPQVATREVQRVAFIRLDYDEKIGDQSSYQDFDAYYSPMQAAWCSMLFDSESLDKLKNVHHFDDLTEEWKDLWNTTVYLLLAFDGKPIDLEHATNGNWNILDVISRFGHRIDQEVMLLALKLYLRFAREISPTGSLTLHEAAKIQISYKNRRQTSATTVYRKTDTLINCPVTRRVSMSFSKLLESNTSAASVFDRGGRLPLHLALQYCKRNQQEMFSMKRQECDSHSVDGYELQSVPMIEALVAANPEALNCVEPSTGLCPFLLAASDNTAVLDIVFSLLSLNPTVLQNATVLSPQGNTKRKRECPDVILSPSVTPPTLSRTTPNGTSCTTSRIVSPLMWNPSARKVPKLI